MVLNKDTHSPQVPIDCAHPAKIDLNEKWLPKPGMTQYMDMTAMDKIFISKSIRNFKKWY